MAREQIGYLLKQISDRMSTTADASLRRHELTFSQVRVLDCIQRMGGEATQKEIEDCLVVAHPTVVGLVGRLEDHGFIISCVDKTDRRNKRIRLCKRAVDMYEFIRRDRMEMEKRLCKGFSEEELDRFQDFLTRLYRNLDE